MHSEYQTFDVLPSNHLNDPIVNYLWQYIIKIDDYPPSKRKEMLYRLSQALAISAGLLSGIPWFDSAKKSAEDLEWLGWIFSLSTLITFASGATWALLNLAELLKPDSPEEVINKASKKRRITFKHIIINFFGIVSTFPTVYAGYKFNTIKWFASIVFFSTYGFNTLGFYQVDFTKLFSYVRKARTTLILQNDQTKTYLKNMLAYAAKEIINVPENERDYKFSSLYLTHSNSVDSADKALNTKLFIQQMCDLYEARNVNMQAVEWGNGWPLKITQLAFSFVPMTATLVNIYLALESSSLLFDNKFFDIIFTIFTNAPGLFLGIYASTSLSGLIFENLFNFLKGNPKKNLIDHIYPKISKSHFLSWAPVILTLFSASSRVYVTYNTLDQDSKLPLTIISTLGSAFIEIFALQDLYSRLLTIYATRHGSENLKRTYKFCTRLNRYFKMLDYVDNVNFLVSPRRYSRMSISLSTPIALEEKEEEKVKIESKKSNSSLLAYHFIRSDEESSKRRCSFSSIAKCTIL